MQDIWHTQIPTLRLLNFLHRKQRQCLVKAANRMEVVQVGIESFLKQGPVQHVS
jgi:hypothetical protein